MFAGHLAHVFLTKHGRTYLAGMIRGWIPEDLAREKHRRWWEAETGARHAATEAGIAEAAPRISAARRRSRRRCAGAAPDPGAGPEPEPRV